MGGRIRRRFLLMITFVVDHCSQASPIPLFPRARKHAHTRAQCTAVGGHHHHHYSVLIVMIIVEK